MAIARVPRRPRRPAERDCERDKYERAAFARPRLIDCIETMELEGKTALITGGKRIGAVVAASLAEHGMDVALSYMRSKDEAEADSHSDSRRWPTRVPVSGRPVEGI